MKNLSRIGALFLTLSLVFTLSAAAAPAAAPATTAVRDNMRGVWVSTVYNLDYPSAGTTDAAALRKQADKILDGAKSMGMNAIFLQVRPSSDAIYPSDIFPWSEYLTGKQGTAPAEGFDALKYWVDGAHRRGIELHAWLNPYRITKGKDAEWATLSPKNPAKLHPEWVVKHDGNYYYNPGIPEVRDLVVRGVQEILDRYAVDGIHLDDYFYPGTDFNDAAAFQKYGTGFANIADWRRDSVNKLVAALDQTVHAKSKTLAFGISPSGVWDNQPANARGSKTNGGNPSYSKNYADGLAWIKAGTIDYICPQIYWYIGQTAADYQILTDWWASAVRGTDVRLYIGEAAYKVDDKAAGAAWAGATELMKHMALCAKNSEIDGNIFFRYGSFDTASGIRTALTQYYAANAIVSPSTTQQSPPAEAPPSVPHGEGATPQTEILGFTSALRLFFEAIIR